MHSREAHVVAAAVAAAVGAAAATLPLRRPRPVAAEESAGQGWGRRTEDQGAGGTPGERTRVEEHESV